jgi:hypothetical protein
MVLPAHNPRFLRLQRLPNLSLQSYPFDHPAHSHDFRRRRYRPDVAAMAPTNYFPQCDPSRDSEIARKPKSQPAWLYSSTLAAQALPPLRARRLELGTKAADPKVAVRQSNFTMARNSQPFPPQPESRSHSEPAPAGRQTLAQGGSPGNHAKFAQAPEGRHKLYIHFRRSYKKPGLPPG